MAPADIAIAHVAARTRRHAERDVERIAAALDDADVAASVETWSRGFLSASRLTINFHPDRRVADRTVAAAIADEGRYLSQWATGVSNGSRSAIPGGQRTRWETELFGDAYDGAPPTDRPLFGVLDPLADTMGGGAHFGSCHLVLGPHVADRSTFCVGDSHQGPSDVGTADAFAGILAGLAEQAATGALLARNLGVVDLVGLMGGERRPPTTDRRLESYVEAQIHGGVSLPDDVEHVVADPAFRGTPVEGDLVGLADVAGVGLSWNAGSELAAEDFPTDFRHADLPQLATSVARSDGVVDAAAIGRYAARIEPGSASADGDGPRHPLQLAKHLWQALVVFGHERID